MRGRGVRGALTAGCAIMALTASSCSNLLADLRTSPGLGIVAKVEIDRDGAEVVSALDAPPAEPAGDGNAVCPPLSIAMVTELDGPDTTRSLNIRNGIQLAVDKHNAANRGCQVQLKPFYATGDPAQAASLAGEIVEDPYTVGLVGPAFSGEVSASGKVFDRAGLVAATPSASDAELSRLGWRTFFRGIANTAFQGSAIANYMSRTLGHRKVCVVDDSSEHGLGLAKAVRKTLGDLADSACNVAVDTGGADFSVVAQIKAVAPDAVFFAGHVGEAVPLLRRLREGGFEGAFVTMHGTMAEEFIDKAGIAAHDALLSCPCAPAPPEFVDEYTGAFGQPPGPYAVEAYDLGTILLRGIDSGAITRPALLDFVGAYDGQGIARRYRWVADGELENPSTWIYQVQ